MIKGHMEVIEKEKNDLNKDKAVSLEKKEQIKRFQCSTVNPTPAQFITLGQPEDESVETKKMT
jgi:hypothetical protein